MLSKVLKGDRAGRASAMAFGTAAPAVNDLRLPTPFSGLKGDGQTRRQPGGGENESILLARIQALEDGVAAARRDAFEAGRREGEQDTQAAIAPILERMNVSIAEVVSLRPELRRRAEKDAVELSLQIAKRILHRELSTDRNALNALARVAFDRLSRTEAWQLTIHPQFADAVRDSLPAASAAKVQIHADPSCAQGTFLVRCSDGAIDASIDSQLGEISRGLTDRLSNS